MSNLAVKANLKTVPCIYSLPRGFEDGKEWSDTINLRRSSLVGQISHVEKCLRAGKDHPKYLLGLMAPAKPELLIGQHFTICDPVVCDSMFELRTPLGQLKGRSSLVSLKIERLDAPALTIWAVAFPHVSLIVVGIGRSITEALKKWENDFKWLFFETYERIKWEDSWSTNRDWKAWCDVLSLVNHEAIRQMDDYRLFLEEDEATFSYFGQVVNVDGGVAQVRWLNAKAGEESDLGKIPGFPKIQALGNGAWFSTQVVQRLSTSEILFIVDAVRAEEPETGRLSEAERHKLLSRHSKLPPGLRNGPITDK